MNPVFIGINFNFNGHVAEMTCREECVDMLT